MDKMRAAVRVAPPVLAALLSGCQQMPIAAPEVTADCRLRAEPVASAPSRGLGLGLGIPLTLGGTPRSRSDTASPLSTDSDMSESMESPREHRSTERRSAGGIGFALDLGSLGGNSGEQNLPRQLAESGPSFPASYSMSCMPIRGFVRGGWPMVIDFEPDGASLVAIEIHLAGSDRPFVFPLDGKGGRQLVRFELPAALGDATQPAIVLVRAVKDQPGMSTPGKLRLYALGAGPRAVGSVAIDEVEFSPDTVIVSRQEKALYRFHSRSDFNRVAAEVLRLQPKNGEIQVSLAHARQLTDGVSRDSWVGRPEPLTWDGTDGREQVSQGLHLLQVRAWLGSQDQGDWVTAWSPDTIQVIQ